VTTLTDMLVRSATERMLASLAGGDASMALHAATCGTSTTYAGHCQLECACWCHGPVEVPK
jgi:hypothetical protein